VEDPFGQSAIRNPQSAIGGGGGAVKYFVTIGPQTVEVEVDGDRVLVGGEAVDVPLAGTPLYHLLLGGESWTVAAQPLEEDGRWAMGAVGERVEVAVQDERTRAAAALAVKGPEVAGGATVHAPMPGLVVRIEVAEGQQVDAGAGLVVVEAMKMENELRAPRAGVVQTVHVAAGQPVEKGMPLVTLT
jgi:biotin carboxyl carrier protein